MRCRIFEAALVASVLLAGSDAQAQPASAPAAAQAPAQAASEAALTGASTANQTAQARYYAKQADKDPSGPPAWLQTVLGGLIAIASGLSTLLLTTWFAERKVTEAREQTYKRHQFQLQLAAKELDDSLSQLSPKLPPWVNENVDCKKLLAWVDEHVVHAKLPAWVNEKVLYEEPRRPIASCRDDPYYLKYDLVNCVYRLCAFLGWLELYRTDGTFLRGPSTQPQQRTEDLFSEVRKDLADPFTFEKDKLDARDWNDGFILDDEQRAIGEKMIDRQRSDVIGYAAFCEILFRSPKRDDPTNWNIPDSQNWWIWNATRFIFELNTRPATVVDGQTGGKLALPTFGLIRVSRLLRHCAELDTLLRKPVSPGNRNELSVVRKS